MAHNNDNIKAYIHFAGDPSVGLFSYGCTVELPFTSWEGQEREEVRQLLTECYTQIDGEFKVSFVMFDDENDNDY